MKTQRFFICLFSLFFCISVMAEPNYNQYITRAQNGDMTAQFNIGQCLYYGYGVAVNKAEAFSWWLKAAQKGYRDAQFNVAYCYENSDCGVSQDYAQAFYWFKKAAEQGFPNAQFQVGNYYERGKGVSTNYNEAYNWYKKSFDNGVDKASYFIGGLYEEDREGWTKNHDEAIKWYRIGVKLGIAESMYKMGLCYHEGNGVPQNNYNAFAYYKLAMDANESNVGLSLILGFKLDNLLKEMPEALKSIDTYRFCLDAFLDDTYSQYLMGVRFRVGDCGVETDYNLSTIFLTKAAEKGHARAQVELGYNYERGYGATPSGSEAVKWYRKSAEQGDPAGLYNMGIMFMSGKGVARDRLVALNWFRKADQQGNSSAREHINELQKQLELDTRSVVGVEMVDLGLPSGTKWANVNIGANAPEQRGFFFAWGETQPKSNYTWGNYKYCRGTESSITKYVDDSRYGTVDNMRELSLEDDAAHVLWGGYWHTPTHQQIHELRDRCTWTWTSRNGVSGYRVTGPNGKSIFLPLTGAKEGTTLDATHFGFYMTSSMNETKLNYFLAILSDCVLVNSTRYRCHGHVIRPVCNW